MDGTDTRRATTWTPGRLARRRRRVVTDGRRLLLVGAAVAALLCPGCGARRGRQPPSQVGGA
ncbi:MAG: hypothetical protein PVF43_12025, partial [Candidatus Eiseniibacteriota bacterium]